MTKTTVSPGARRSLATTLTIALLAISLGALVLASSLLLMSSVWTQQKAIAVNQQLIAANAAAAVRSYIHEQTNDLVSAVRLGGVRASSPEGWKPVLESLLGFQRSFKHLAVLDGGGHVLARVSRVSESAAAEFVAGLDARALADHSRAGVYVSPVMIDPVSSEPEVLVAVPVADMLGGRHGTLVADMSLKFMWDLVDQLRVGDTGYAYVVDRQGTLLAFSDTARVLKGENVAALGAVRAFAAGSTGAESPVTTYTGLAGDTVLGGYVALGTPDWAVVTEVPLAEAYGGIAQDLALAAGVLLATAALAGVTGIVMARRLTVPLVNLMSIASRIAGGERGAQAAVAGPREVANLAVAFNSMAAQLAATVEGLEQRVEQRTADLSAALAEVEARSRAQEELLAQNAQQREALRELGVPVLPVTDDTLVLPLIGTLDERRLADVQERALRALQESRSRRLLLDVTGVPIIDSQVAQGLIGVAQSARLLGAEVMLIGIRPEVAQTIVGLGLDLTAVRTAADLQTAIVGRAR